MTIPRNIDAERMLLGSMLMDPSIIDQVTEAVIADDFYEPKHADLFSLLLQMRARESLLELPAVVDELRRRGDLERFENGLYLIKLMELVGTPASWSYYSGEMSQTSRQRRLREIGLEIVQRAESTNVDVDQTLASLRKQADDLEERCFPAGIKPDTVGDLISQKKDETFIIPGLFAENDRLVYTGPEGHGKSWLSRQFAVCLAAGIHPFEQGMDITPAVVQMIELENSPSQSARVFDRMVAQAISQGKDPTFIERLRVTHRMEGLNLTKPDDQRWLRRLVASVRPRLLILGPFKALHVGLDMNHEDVAAELLGVLTSIRARFGCAMMIEAHAAHATDKDAIQRDSRPRGSSALLGWPEMGYGLKGKWKLVEVDVDGGKPRKEWHQVRGQYRWVKWRGDREKRYWPEELHHNIDKSGRLKEGWPWVLPPMLFDGRRYADVD